MFVKKNIKASKQTQWLVYCNIAYIQIYCPNKTMSMLKRGNQYKHMKIFELGITVFSNSIKLQIKGI